jgi:hypothetical protein
MSATTERERETLLRRVQALLAKAEATQFEGERDSFFAKAEELMNKYRIELWELQQREHGRLDARQPIVRNLDYSWAFDSGPFPAICDSLWYSQPGGPHSNGCADGFSRASVGTVWVSRCTITGPTYTRCARISQ